MACGLPLVASAAAGPREIIDQGTTGALVDIDDESGFAAAIDQYLRNPARARQHGAAGRARVVERFSIHRQSREIAGAIRQALN
jgi:glycosyltransferase involved in cell wall biosynthesis